MQADFAAAELASYMADSAFVGVCTAVSNTMLSMRAILARSSSTLRSLQRKKSASTKSFLVFCPKVATSPLSRSMILATVSGDAPLSRSLAVLIASGAKMPKTHRLSP